MGHSTGSGRVGPENAGISLLQSRVRNSQTNQLMGAYNQLADKPIREMTNEEKMVRAILIDELTERGQLIVDAKTGEYVKNTTGDHVVFDSEKNRSYRVGRAGIVQNVASGKETTSREAEFYFNGQWVEVKNLQTKVKVAKLAERSRR